MIPPYHVAGPVRESRMTPVAHPSLTPHPFPIPKRRDPALALDVEGDGELLDTLQLLASPIHRSASKACEKAHLRPTPPSPKHCGRRVFESLIPAPVIRSFSTLRNSANFALTEFYEVRLTWHLRNSRPT